MHKTNFYGPSVHNRLLSEIFFQMLWDVTCSSQSNVGSMSLRCRCIYNCKAVLLPTEFAFLREEQHDVDTLSPAFLCFCTLEVSCLHFVKCVCVFKIRVLIREICPQLALEAVAREYWNFVCFLLSRCKWLFIIVINVASMIPWEANRHWQRPGSSLTLQLMQLKPDWIPLWLSKAQSKGQALISKWIMRWHREPAHILWEDIQVLSASVLYKLWSDVHLDVIQKGQLNWEELSWSW